MDDGPVHIAIRRAANLTIRRTSAAFRLDHRRFELALSTTANGLALRLAYRSAQKGAPIVQRRHVSTLGGTPACAAVEVRGAVDVMVWNMALAHQPARPGPPTGWSIHPAVSAIAAAAGTGLPNPADPASWLPSGTGDIFVGDGGPVVGVAFAGREGALMLRSATIVDRLGAPVATLCADLQTMRFRFHGAFPESLALALPGRDAAALCDVFSADPRIGPVSIVSAHIRSDGPPQMTVQLEDRLIPLSPTCAGGERWRPRRMRPLFGPARCPVPSDLLANYTQGVW